MRLIGKITLALGLMAVLSATANAQGMRGMGMGMGGPMAGLGVLMNPAGQKELDLTEEQVEKVREMSENLRADMMEKFQGMQDVPQEERQEKMQSIMKEIGSEIDGKIKEVLKDEQYARYKQISLQQMGVDAFDQEDVAKKLELTDDQKSKIDEIQEDMQEKTRAAFQEAMDSGDRQGLMPKMQEIRGKAKTEALAVLTDSQKKTWEEMTGKEFSMPMGFGGQRRRPID